MSEGEPITDQLITQGPLVGAWEPFANPLEHRDSIGFFEFQGRLWVQGASVIPPGANGHEVFSTDGESWIYHGRGDWLGQRGPTTVVFKDQVYIVGNAFHDDVYRTADPASGHWDLIATDTPWGIRHGAVVVAFDDKLWLMGGMRFGPEGWAPGYLPEYDYEAFNDVWVSEDGITWTQVLEHAPWGPRAHGDIVVFNGKMYMASGGVVSVLPFENTRVHVGEPYRDVWSSSDGINWTLETDNAPWNGRTFFNLAVFQGQLVLFGGSVGPDHLNLENDFWVSSDGKTWTQTDYPGSPTHASGTRSFNDDLYVAVGIQAPGEVWRIDGPKQNPDQAAAEDQAFSLVLDSNAFDSIPASPTYSAVLSDGSPLPSWLVFDPDTVSFSGTPDNGDVGWITVVVQAVGDGESGAAMFKIIVGNTNDAPGAKDLQVGLNPDAQYVFADSGLLFADQDLGDTLQALQIESLPGQGALMLGSVAVGIGQIIAAADLASLRFIPVAGESGADYALFTFRTQDQAGVFSAAVSSITFDVESAAPQAVNTTLLVQIGELRSFSAVDFGFTDPNADDSLKGVRIDALPTAGTLSWAGAAVAVGQIILVADLGQLTFVAPDASAAPSVAIGFSVVDQTDLMSTLPATLTVEVNRPPTAADVTINVPQNWVLMPTIEDFGFGDLDAGDEFSAIIINSLPSQGSFVFHGAPITVGQVIPAYMASQIAYIPRGLTNFAYEAPFSFSVRDSRGAVSAPATFTLVVDQLIYKTQHIGDDTANVLTGDDGNNNIVGAGGDDIITPLRGEDYIDGGTGSDTVSFAGLSQDLSLRLHVTEGQISGAGTKWIAGVENVIGGSGADHLTGSDANNRLEGGAGNDLLIGLDGDDVLRGGAGNDNLYGGDSGDAPDGLDTAEFDGNRADYRIVEYGNGVFAVADQRPGAPDGFDVTSEIELFRFANGTVAAANLINDAPAGADKTIVMSEGIAYSLKPADFGFSDPNGDGFAGFVITSLPANGRLFYIEPDFIFEVGDFLDAAMMAEGLLMFRPGADGNGASYATLGFQVRDNGGTLDGGQNLDPLANTLTFDVTPVNDAPALDLDSAQLGTGATASYTENEAPIRLAPRGLVSDVDGGSYLGATLRVEVTNGAVGVDVLGIVNQGTGPGQIGYASGIVTYEGAAIARVVPVPGALTPVLNIEFFGSGISSVPIAAVGALIRAVSYANTSDAPGTATRSAQFELHDPAGAAIVQTATINLVPVDDPSVAKDDFFVTDQATTVWDNLFADHGFGADIDPDSLITLTAVNGSTSSVGSTITLASGARLTVSANGNVLYDPNGAFGHVPWPGSGASNMPAEDSFTYTINGSATATVTIRVSGMDDDDVLLGTSGNDVLRGGIGNDELFGLGGADTLIGGVGNDKYYIDNPADVVTELGGEGTDHLFTSVGYVLASAAEIEVLGTGDASGHGAIALTGNGFSQTLFGNAGNNLLDGAGGGDLMVGYGGDDWFVVRNAADRVAEASGGGTDRIFAYVSFTLAAGASVETLGTYNRTTGEAINLTGNEVSQTLLGNAGNNVLDGGGGGDLLRGFEGNDWFIVRSAADRVDEVAGAGTDRVFAYVSYALNAGASVETLGTYNHTTSEAFNLTGNAVSQTLLGNAGSNVLDGGGGGDLMVGYGGDDWFVVRNTVDRIDELSGEGTDRVFAYVSYALNAGAAVETLGTYNHTTSEAINLAGNGFSQTLLGNAGNNVLDGGGGADILRGFEGDDWYIVRSAADRVDEVSGGGTDRVFAYVSYTLAAGASVETLGTYNHTTSEAFNLTGNAVSQTVLGNAGSNVLDGGGGGDLMVGYGGDDWFVVRNAADRVDELSGDGTDRVFAYVSYALNAGAAVEILGTYNHTTTETINLKGNELGQTMLGNAGNNILDGGSGCDLLRGFGGSDAFRFSTALGEGNVDEILDFEAGIDKIAFAGVTPEALGAGAFHVGRAAQDADDRIIFDPLTGALLYDGDGSGGGAAVQFAILHVASLSASDFIAA